MAWRCAGTIQEFDECARNPVRLGGVLRDSGDMARTHGSGEGGHFPLLGFDRGRSPMAARNASRRRDALPQPIPGLPPHPPAIRPTTLQPGPKRRAQQFRRVDRKRVPARSVQSSTACRTARHSPDMTAIPPADFSCMVESRARNPSNSGSRESAPIPMPGDASSMATSRAVNGPRSTPTGTAVNQSIANSLAPPGGMSRESRMCKRNQFWTSVRKSMHRVAEPPAEYPAAVVASDTAFCVSLTPEGSRIAVTGATLGPSLRPACRFSSTKNAWR